MRKAGLEPNKIVLGQANFESSLLELITNIHFQNKM